MRKVFTILSGLALTATTAWAQDYTEIDRSNWEVTAYANHTSAIEGPYDGCAGAMLDGNTSTYFHSAWTSAPDNQNDGGVNPGAFMVNMGKEETISKIALTPRLQGVVKNAPLKGRVYISEKPLVDLTALTTETHLTALTQKALGEPTASFEWKWESSDAETIVFSTAVKGQYILFIADETGKTDQNWFCVAEFQAYTLGSTGGGGNEESEPEASFTVDISDRAQICDVVTRTTTILKEGTTKVSPGEFMIMRHDDNYAINSVKKGDEVITAPYGYYYVELAENETVDIVCTWVGDATITLSDKDAIASITAAGVNVPVNSTEVLVPMGTKVVITLNEGYTTTDNLTFYATYDSYSITATVPELFTLTVDNASKVTLFNENREEHTLVNGDQKFSPGNYQIKSVTGYMINKVTLNGETVVGNNGVYDVTAAKNDKIVVTAEYEAEDYNITFNDLAAIKSVTTAYDGEQLAIGEMEGIYFTASYPGYKITVELNEGYTSESALVFYLTQNVQIVTKVAEPEPVPTAIENVSAPAKANIVKTIENGKVVIIRDGERYDITGRKL